MVRECPRWSHHRLLIAPYCHLPCLCRVIYLLSYPDDLPICTQNVGCASTSFASWSGRKECNVCVWAVSQAHSIHSCKCSCPKPPLGASGVGKLVFFCENHLILKANIRPADRDQSTWGEYFLQGAEVQDKVISSSFQCTVYWEVWTEFHCC